jgi:CheY-like chemotaxis protein/HPt (histidine-containing phosphotransfer) domain-containing protein
VTEVRQAAEDLASARDGALLASKAKSEFLSTMSHEIRTPMNGVIGLTELLLTTTLDAEQEELASGIKVSAESLLGIINDILDFSKIEAGKLELEEAGIDVSSVVDDVGRILAVAAHKKGLELIVDVAADVPQALVGDKVRLQQVLLNLGSNAVKFTSEGEVVIRLVVLHQNEGRVALRFEVIDMGIGIAPDDQQRLFRAFSQADSSTTRRFGGTGLGLAIARQLVELMGGRLGLISAPGEGSTFWFEVSLGRGESSSPRRHEGEAASMAGQRAVIIDDNATNRRILRQQLASWGIESVEAADAYEAIKVIAAAARTSQPFDLGIVDLNMPGVDGMELAQVLKSERATAGITLFLLSSSGERLGAAESHLRGFAACLTKPVRSSELFDCLITNLRPGQPPATALEQADTQTIDTPEAMGVILLVEDNKTNQLVGSKVLARLGYSFDIANDGREALYAINAKAYDAVLMDCQMPEMDGYEATAAIRRIEAASGGPRLPIIAMTAAAMEGDRETCIAAGMDDYITKPVQIEAIAEVLDRWVRRPSQAASSTDAGGNAPCDQPAREPIDQSQIDLLRSLDDGDGTVLAEIVDHFLAEADQAGRELAASVSSGDCQALHRIAHTMKGASANVGATGLAEVCDHLETCGRQGEIAGAAGLVQRFDSEYARVRDALGLLTARARA